MTVESDPEYRDEFHPDVVACIGCGARQFDTRLGVICNPNRLILYPNLTKNPKCPEKVAATPSQHSDIPRDRIEKIVRQGTSWYK